MSKEISLADFNRKIAYVAQDNYLFNETVRENIRQGNPEATDEQIIEVTKKSGCYEFIMQLENGFDTVVGGCRRTSVRRRETAYLDCKSDAEGCSDRDP